MTGPALFIRSRRWVIVLAITVTTAVLIAVVGQLTYSLSPRGALVIAIAGQLPVIPAIATQATLQPGLRQQELGASRDLRVWRVAHLVVLTAGAAVGLLVATAVAGTTLDLLGAGPGLALVRNFLALLGASLIGACLFGAVFAWTLPVAWLIVPYLVISRPDQDPIGILTLTNQNSSAFVAFVFACSIWVVGVAIAANDLRVAVRGNR